MQASALMAQLISSNKRVVCPFVGLIRDKSCLALNPSYLFPFAGDEMSSCLEPREEAGAGLLSPQLWNYSEMGILCVSLASPRKTATTR